MELTADNRVEWHQQEQKIVAVGNAVAIRKDLRVRADTMSADYKKLPPDNKTQITAVHARGSVIMSSTRADAFGDTLDYDLGKDSMLLQALRPKSKPQPKPLRQPTASPITPMPKKPLPSVMSGPTMGKDKVFGDKMIAYFEPKSPPITLWR